MALPYDKALQVWGVQKLHSKYPDVEFDLSTIHVDHEYYVGFGCESCGEEVDSEITVLGKSSSGAILRYTFDWRVDLSTFIKEVVEAGEGTITSE